jgi:hypothetical protein
MFTEMVFARKACGHESHDSGLTALRCGTHGFG